MRKLLACSTMLLVMMTGVTARAAGEAEGPPRPPLPPGPAADPVPWQPHGELGGDVAVVSRAGTRLRPSVGFGVHGGWEIFRYLHFEAYFVDSRHNLLLPPGALDGRSTIASSSVATYSFGACLLPTLPLSSRARVWVRGGIGWGRLQYPRMVAMDSGGAPFVIRERADSFAEVPLGFGASFDLIKRWLSVRFEASGAFALEQSGTASTDAQAIDASGKKRDIGGLPLMGASYVETLGLSFLL